MEVGHNRVEWVLPSLVAGPRLARLLPPNLSTKEHHTSLDHTADEIVNVCG